MLFLEMPGKYNPPNDACPSKGRDLSMNAVLKSQAVLMSAHAGRLALSVGTVSLLGRNLEPSAFGFVALVSSVYLVAVEVLDLGTTAVAIREVAARPAEERDVLTAL